MESKQQQYMTEPRDLGLKILDIYTIIFLGNYNEGRPGS